MELPTLALTRDQAVSIVEFMLCAALDTIDTGLPTDLGLPERLVLTRPSSATDLTAYETGAIETAGMAVSILYAQLTGDGMEASDALHGCLDFEGQIRCLMARAWADPAYILEWQTKLGAGGRGFTREELYEGYWPDCAASARHFVDRYLSEVT